MVAVAALVVIAIAGIVLAGLGAKGSDPASTPAVTDATLPATSAMTAATEALARAETEAGPNTVVFAPESGELSEPASVKLVRFAEEARKVKRGTVVIASRVEAGPANLELARKRAMALRRVLEANGVPPAAVKIRVEQAPPGVVSPAESNRISFSLS